jgi:pyruvate formate lyase activating enzyme
MRFSVNDGPGIRTTVFFKGCPLSCLWCHNPESLQRATEIVLRDDRCIQCGECLTACTHGAISRDDGRVVTDRALCSRCGDCVAHCYADARELVGREMTPDDVMRQVLQDRLFFDQSGGGVTFSGGEPLLQHEFLLALLTASKQEGLHTVLDTTGHTTPQILERIAPLVDLFLYDLKMMDDAQHRSYTGVSNRLPLENLRHLVEGEKEIIVRIPLIPGVNDDSDNIRSSGELLASLHGIREVHVLPYHTTGVSKYHRIGKSYALSTLKPPDHDAVMRAIGVLRRYVPSVIVGG